MIKTNREDGFLYKKFLSFFVFLILISINNIVFAKEENGTFEKLKGTYGATAIVLNKDEIFLPSEFKAVKEPSGITIVHHSIALPAQIYNIKKKKFIALNTYMHYSRNMYLAIKLDDNRILIFGGEGRKTLDFKPQEHIKLKSAEIYDINTNTFKQIDDTNYIHNRVNSNCLKLNDGRIFISSGDKIEIFDPNTEKFYLAGEEKQYKQRSILDPNEEKIRKRTTINIYNHRTALALLKDGRVLIVGANYNGEPGNAEIYDPNTNKYTLVGEQVFPSFYRDATTLNDGRVLITGGTRSYYGYSFNKKK